MHRWIRHRFLHGACLAPGGGGARFLCFLGDRNRRQKTLFFQGHLRSIKMIHKWTMGTPRVHLERFYITLWNHSGMFLSLFGKWRKAWIHCTGHSSWRFPHRKINQYSISFHRFFDLRSGTTLGLHFWTNSADLGWEDRFWVPLQILGGPKWTI